MSTEIRPFDRSEEPNSNWYQISSVSHVHERDAEPADPERTDHASRRENNLVPESVNLSVLPKPLREEENGTKRPPSVAEARRTYMRIQRAAWNKEKRTSAYEYQCKRTYPQLLAADRRFRHRYDGLTTVMITRRLSPLDERDDWLTPWECNEMLHGEKIHRSVRQALDYHLDRFEFEWVAVTAPTESAGTPHEHIYLWIDDPDDEVTTAQVEPALDKHMKYCANAYEKHHRYRSDGTDGAIKVRHSPPLVYRRNDKVAKQVAKGNTPPQLNTAGAQYLASQLAHLPLGDYYAEQEPDPPLALFEGAALAWASPYNWFRSSGGVPTLD